jgi:ABC-type nitrate/sulfonate/bicarbonate transport system permease component
MMVAFIPSRDKLISILTPVALLALWEIGARLGFVDTRFFSSPTLIAHQFVVLSRSGEIWLNIGVSLQRLGIGFVVGGVPAIVLGIAMGLSRPIRAAIDPLIAASYPLPKSAIFPLILLIFGLGEASKIVMVALGVFYPLIINTMTGVLQIERIYLDVGKNFGASRRQMFYTVALPGALPSIFAGIKLGVGMGLVLIAISEMIGADSGLGYMIWNAWQTLSVETMYVGLVVIAIIGYVMSVLLDELESWMLPWKRGR